jgi:hypothetical protein
MKIVGLHIVIAAALVAIPAAAQDSGAKPAAPSGNMFDRLWTSITGPDSAEPATGTTKVQVIEHAKSENDDAAGQPAALRSSDADTADKDSYKPDAGDSGH